MTGLVASPAEQPRHRRARRSCLAVPGSSARMIEKSVHLASDQIFFDLEDAVAPHRKKEARRLVIDALNSLDFGSRLRVVRVNDVTTGYAYGDIVELVTSAGHNLDCVLLPKVQSASHVHFVHHLLSGLEVDLGLERRIGLELLIETASGAVNLAEIAIASSRTEAIIFGPGDYTVDLRIPRFNFGMIDPDYPGHQWHWVMSSIANHARATGVPAIDGPYVDFSDEKGYSQSALRARLLGFEGKWCVHPNQVPWANAAFSPTPQEFAYAAGLLAAFEEAIAGGRGAAVYDGKLIDEASRKLAQTVVEAGRVARLTAPSPSR
jgi:citrate lyase beta subunit